MFKKLSVLLVSAVFVGSFSFASVSHAEGDTFCNGRIVGVTVKDNVNGGVTSFNSHLGFGVEDNEATDLSIVGKQSGLAPADRALAACVAAEEGTYKGEAYKYSLKGFAWNTNVGFVSFNCKNGVNLAGEGTGVACGGVDYGVYINDKNELFGHAWSPSFGWIQFKGTGLGAKVGPTSLGKGKSIKVDSYNVTYIDKFTGGNYQSYFIDLDGDVAKIDVPLGNQFPQVHTYKNGVKLTLLDGSIKFNLEIPKGTFNYGVTMDKDGIVSGSAWTGAGVYMNMLGMKIFLPDKEPKVVNGDTWCEGKSWVCVELDPNPVILKVDGKDDVKVADGVDGYYVHLYLRDGAGNPVDKTEFLNFNAFANSISFNWKDTVKLNIKDKVGTALATLKNPWAFAKGALTWKPLSVLDFQQDTKDPAHYVSKQKISSFAPTSESNLSYTTSTKPSYPFFNDNFLGNVGLSDIEKNELILKSVTFDSLKDKNGVEVLPKGVVYANGKVDMYVKFRPAIEVTPLYAGLSQDKFVGYRSIPENVKLGVKVMGRLSDNVTDGAQVTVKLAYDKDQSCLGYSVKSLCEFVFKFVSNDSSVVTKSVADIKDADLDLQTLALLPEYSEEKGGNYATFAKSPTLYTELTYNVDSGHKITYLSNKIPRVPGDKITSPSLVVHGAIQGQLTAAVSENNPVDTSGKVNVNIIRDTINENLQKQLVNNNLSSGSCTIKKLDGSSSCSSGFYKVFKVADENVIYFKGSNVTLDLSAAWKGKWIVISDGGNIFIDANAYAPGESLSLVALRGSGDKYLKTGHVYIHPEVQNVQATLVADGSVFSYSGDHDAIEANGEPKWNSLFERTSALKYQLLIQGAIYSDNTIGGADLDKASNDKTVKPKDYLLLGGGEVVSPGSIDNRLRAQAYDLNYLRMFALDLEIGSNGCPIDQKSGKALCAEEIMAIANGQIVCGEKACDPNKPFDSNTLNNKADGINPLKKYSPTTGADSGPDGDLVLPKDIGLLAKGLDKDTDFGPVYVYYVAPSKDSFLFSKLGSLGIGAN